MWRQLQGAASLLMAVRSGKSMTAALETVDSQLRPGVQALGFHALRHMGLAEALRKQLARRPPPPEADALLCVALACMTPVGNAETPAYTPHTLVDQTVEAAKRDEATRHQASFLNACLRQFLREQPALLTKADHSPQAVWNHPQWWIDRLRKDHPDHWQAILRANNTQASLILRINERKTTQAQYLIALDAMNIEASLIGESGIKLARSHPVKSLPGYSEGHFSVQDAAAQLAAPLLLRDVLTRRSATSETATLTVLDACAAPGGKTAHLLEMADCEVTALEIDARRCERIGENLSRLGLQAGIVVGDAARPADWWNGKPYDAILLDAPCTASGIVRRHPDVRWLRRPTDIAQLAAIQSQLLQTLWPLLKPGGQMLYCTCSVFKDEGERQIETFVAHHKDALLRPSPGHLLPQAAAQGADIPDNLGGEHDGFYYALLEKRLG